MCDNVSQRDRGMVSEVLVDEVRNESKNLWRDTADWCEVVLPGST